MLFLFIFPMGVWGREDLPNFLYFTVRKCESNERPVLLT